MLIFSLPLIGSTENELISFRRTCHPHHKEGIQAYLSVDATPSQGGIAFFTGTGWEQCFYYQPVFANFGIEINAMRPTEFEMVNLLIALFIFKTEILNHRTVRIIADNNNLRKKGKIQRYPLTEAIAAILQWCDYYGCTINDIFESNTREDVPFMLVADKLSRNKDIGLWVKQKKEANLDKYSKFWKFVLDGDYNEISSIRWKAENSLSINRILQTNHFLPESYGECPRFRRMRKFYFEDMRSKSTSENRQILYHRTAWSNVPAPPVVYDSRLYTTYTTTSVNKSDRSLFGRLFFGLIALLLLVLSCLLSIVTCLIILIIFIFLFSLLVIATMRLKDFYF